MAKETGVQYLLSAYEEYTNKGKSDVVIKDGDVIELGKVNIKSIHTPGHTLGSMSFLVEGNDSGNSSESNTVFVNGIGRPDLRDKAKYLRLH